MAAKKKRIAKTVTEYQIRQLEKAKAGKISNKRATTTASQALRSTLGPKKRKKKAKK